MTCVGTASRRDFMSGLVIGAGGLLASGRDAASGHPAPPDRAIVRALSRSAYPLRSTAPDGSHRDLRPLGRMIGDAGVVGLGEATHGSHQFFDLKDRVFRYLVEEKGFTTFMLELGWGTGLELNDYVLYGKGDPLEIMRREFVKNYRLFAVREYVRLIDWMRHYNLTHPHRRPVQFMGDDVYLTNRRIFDEIFRYVRDRGHPGLVPRLEALYDGLIPTTDLRTWQIQYDRRPPRERRRVERQAEQALELVRKLRRGAPREAAEWAEQQATVALWIARTHATADFATPRDEAMALNTVWWYRHKHSKILLSAHNAHVGYLSEYPPHTFKRQGTWLRQILGPAYVAIGTDFYQGSFIAVDPKTALLRKYTVGPPFPRNVEHVLDRVRFRDYMLDMRTAEQPARRWLNEQHQVRNITAIYRPNRVRINNFRQSLGQTYSILVQVSRVTASHPISGLDF